MGELHSTAASLRFTGDDLDPDELSSKLGSGNEGVGLTPKTLSMLGDRGLALECNIYGPADEE